MRDLDIVLSLYSCNRCVLLPAGPEWSIWIAKSWCDLCFVNRHSGGWISLHASVLQMSFEPVAL